MEYVKIAVLVLCYSREVLCSSKYLEDNSTDLLSFQGQKVCMSLCLSLRQGESQGRTPKYSIQKVWQISLKKSLKFSLDMQT